jgi:hypothetical protein
VALMCISKGKAHQNPMCSRKVVKVILRGSEEFVERKDGLERVGGPNLLGERHARLFGPTPRRAPFAQSLRPLFSSPVSLT